MSDASLVFGPPMTNVYSRPPADMSWFPEGKYMYNGKDVWEIEAVHSGSQLPMMGSQYHWVIKHLDQTIEEGVSNRGFMTKHAMVPTLLRQMNPDELAQSWGFVCIHDTTKDMNFAHRRHSYAYGKGTMGWFKNEYVFVSKEDPRANQPLEPPVAFTLKLNDADPTTVSVTPAQGSEFRVDVAGKENPTFIDVKAGIRQHESLAEDVYIKLTNSRGIVVPDAFPISHLDSYGSFPGSPSRIGCFGN